MKKQQFILHSGKHTIGLLPMLVVFFLTSSNQVDATCIPLRFLRLLMNIARDYVWFGKDKAWQEDYAKRFQNFLRSKGMDKYDDQFNTGGTKPEFILQAGPVKKLRHSIGLVSTAATASLINNEKKSIDFVRAIWNAKLVPYGDGYFDPYYDGLMYLFSLMHLSGKYQLI